MIHMRIWHSHNPTKASIGYGAAVRVLISTRWFGGIGGAERNLASMVRALEGHRVDICASRVIPSEFLVEMPHVKVVPKWRCSPSSGRKWLFWWPVVWPLVRLRRRYDIYIQFYTGRSLGRLAPNATKLLIPSGNRTAGKEDDFDYVISQAPDGNRFVEDESKVLLLAPPLVAMSGRADPISTPSDRYFLTVFNPYSEKLKGLDVLAEIADDLPYPLVWCHSERTNQLAETKFEHPNVFHVNDPTQAQLRFLYENCRAYVSFSRSEGFGWALADALIYGRPIISRRLGVLTFFNERPGIRHYDSVDQLRSILVEDDLRSCDVDLSQLGPARFVEALEFLAADRKLPKTTV